jgi:hypothetical protein
MLPRRAGQNANAGTDGISVDVNHRSRPCDVRVNGVQTRGVVSVVAF